MRNTQRILKQVGFQLLALTAVAVFIMPLVWVGVTSLRQPGLPPPRTIEWLPQPPTWANYAQIFAIVPLGQYLVNSLQIVGLAVPLTLLVASWAGFAMAQLTAPVRVALLVLAVVLRMIPITALWLTRFVLFTHLHLIDTIWALIAPAWMGSSPFFVLIFYWTFRRMPAALYDSARIDGLGAWGTWAYVAMPLAWPATMAVSILTFVQYWSDFINPLMYLKSEQHYTFAVGLRTLQQLDATNWPLLMAAAVVMLLPVVLLFFLAQRAFWPDVRLAGVYGK